MSYRPDHCTEPTKFVYFCEEHGFPLVETKIIDKNHETITKFNCTVWLKRGIISTSFGYTNSTNLEVPAAQNRMIND